MSTEEQKKLNLKLEEETAQGDYSNFAIVNHGPDEFVFDFVFVQPGGQQGKVNNRVILSPAHAKRFLQALSTNVEKYQERFGEIKSHSLPTAPFSVTSEHNDSLN